MTPKRQTGVHFALAITLAIASAAACALLWITDWPLGIRGEWTWARIAHPDSSIWDSLLGILQAGLALGCIALIAWWGGRRFARRTQSDISSRLIRATMLLGLVTTGFLGTGLLEHSLPPGYGIGRSPWVLYYPGTSGYYYEARRVTSFDDFRKSYLDVLDDSDLHRRTLHLGTHPPGLFLAHLAVRESCRRSPALRKTLLTWQPNRVREAQATILEAGRPIPPIDTAALWLATLLTQLLAVATLLPIYRLVRIDHSPETAWRAASLWLLVPAVNVFLPKSDCLYPLLATTALWLWWAAIRGHRSGMTAKTAQLHLGLNALNASLAAGIAWIGLCLSLAFLPILALAASLALCMHWQGRFNRRQLLAWSIASFAGIALPTLATWITLDFNLPEIWWSNLANHAAFYDQPEHPRSYWPWLGLNTLELTVALGVPLAGLAIGGLVLRTRQPKPELQAPAWTCLAVWCLLWLSGKNMGESARLWLFLMPWACWLAASALDKLRNRDWAILLLLQAAMALAVVQRVTGFDFARG
jgi:hypothetical protein